MPKLKRTLPPTKPSLKERRSWDNSLIIIDHPVFRSECDGGARPCPLVGCKYNMFLNVNENGAIVFTFPGQLPEEVAEGKSCILDIADEEDENGKLGKTPEEVGSFFSLTRERVRQIEFKALKALRAEIKAEEEASGAKRQHIKLEE